MSPHNCPAVHTDHAAEYLGHDENRRESSAKGIVTSKTSHTTVVDDERGHTSSAKAGRCERAERTDRRVRVHLHVEIREIFHAFVD